MSVVLKNPFGSADGVDLQRKDLWSVNISTVSSFLTTANAGFFKEIGLQKEAVISQKLIDTVRLISLPPRKVATRRILRGSVPVNFPGLVEALEPIRLEVVHQVLGPFDTVSRSYAIFKAWQSLARMGRSDSLVAKLPAASSKPEFRFDVELALLKGSAEGIADDIVSSSLDKSSRYFLKKCWVCGLQLGQIDRSAAAANHTFTVQLQPLDIEEF